MEDNAFRKTSGSAGARALAYIIVIVMALSGAALAGCSAGGGANGPDGVANGAADGAGSPAGQEDGGEAEGGSGQEASAADEIVVKDMIGREIRLAGPATRVVALMAADVETLYAIGAGDRLVGRGEYCNYPPEVLDVEAVQSGNETNVEQIIALQPQLLMMTKVAQNEDQISQFEEAGIQVFVTDAQDIEGTYLAIGLTGQLVGKEAEAEAVVAGMRETFAELSSKASAAAGADAGSGDGSADGADAGQKTIYFEVSPLEYGLWAAGDGTFMNEVAEMLGMRNIFGDVSSWVEVSEEQVLERNPDYILTVGMYFGDGPTPIESILSRPGWESITAIQNKAILNLTADELSRPGPRLALGAQMLYDFVFEGGSATPSEG